MRFRQTNSDKYRSPEYPLELAVYEQQELTQSLMDITNALDSSQLYCPTYRHAEYLGLRLHRSPERVNDTMLSFQYTERARKLRSAAVGITSRDSSAHGGIRARLEYNPADDIWESTTPLSSDPLNYLTNNDTLSFLSQSSPTIEFGALLDQMEPDAAAIIAALRNYASKERRRPSTSHSVYSTMNPIVQEDFIGSNTASVALMHEQGVKRHLLSIEATYNTERYGDITKQYSLEATQSRHRDKRLLTVSSGLAFVASRAVSRQEFTELALADTRNDPLDTLHTGLTTMREYVDAAYQG